MGYLVETSGRLLLPEPLEPQVLTVLEVELLRHDGSFGEEDVEVVDALADLARFAGVTLTREGDWLGVATDAGGDRRWSDQATAFYEGLARWVLQGEVRVHGEDGESWAYRYTPDGMVREAAGEPAPAVFPETPEPATWGTAPPPSERDFWDDAPESRPPGRMLAMTALLVVGVLLVIGVAFLAAGIAG